MKVRFFNIYLKRKAVKVPHIHYNFNWLKWIIKRQLVRIAPEASPSLCSNHFQTDNACPLYDVAIDLQD